MAKIIIYALMVLGALSWTTFVVGYAILADWKATRWGRSVMRLHAGFAAILDYAVVAVSTQPWPPWLILAGGVVVYGIVAGLGIQQSWMMFREQLKTRKGNHRRERT